MTVSTGMPDALACDDRSRLLAVRMLQGSAAATLFAYRLGETLDPVVHGVAADGALAVVALPRGRWAEEQPGRVVDVRLDLVKNSLDPRVSTVVASAHALGGLVWAEDDETDARLVDGSLPEALRQSLTVPGARLGWLLLDRLVVHDLSGAVVVPHAELPLAPPALDGGLTGLSLVTACSDAALKDVCWSVMVGRTPGTVTRKPHAGHACPHTLDQIFCADVDALGVTLLLVTAQDLVVVHGEFEQLADSADALNCLVHQLVAQAAPSCDAER
ncbi:hypothetical protein [Propioniciclava soli]|uniref:Uncharacterized protein n=1 Tax=Propioniciclava soli TaxID=2775081 RepID=A0ABZ3CA90_9ACTN|nr:hypothetical protein [Propioniciclava soli]